jgi:hypothetical protein
MQNKPKWQRDEERMEILLIEYERMISKKLYQKNNSLVETQFQKMHSTDLMNNNQFERLTKAYEQWINDVVPLRNNS